VLAFLAVDLAQVGVVCQRLASLAAEDCLWRAMCARMERQAVLPSHCEGHPRRCGLRVCFAFHWQLVLAAARETAPLAARLQ
jgi:hypothetical protein